MWKPLIVNTLGQTETDNINWMISITIVNCLGVKIEKDKNW